MYGLTWDDYYPKSYNYQKSDDLKKLTKMIDDALEKMEEEKKELVINYDKENDVCYINFYNPPLEADSSNMVGDTVFRSKKGKPIGATIMCFSKYKHIIKLLAKEGAG
jgi:hypothetical protein